MRTRKDPFGLEDNDLTRWEQALLFASRLHAAQDRKGTVIPYVSHLLAVAGLVLEHGGTEGEAIAALLHDAIEDQAQDRGGVAVLRRAITDRFGESVAAIVDGCTDVETDPKPPWRERKEVYVVHIRTASASVRLVSCADKLHNARAILADYREVGEVLWGRFTAGSDEILWYYRALVEAFGQGGVPAALHRELRITVTELERLVASAAWRP